VADPESFLRECGTVRNFFQDRCGMRKQPFIIGKSESFCSKRGAAALPLDPPLSRLNQTPIFNKNFLIFFFVIFKINFLFLL
jgi:hypothetical protein